MWRFLRSARCAKSSRRTSRIRATKKEEDVLLRCQQASLVPLPRNTERTLTQSSAPGATRVFTRPSSRAARRRPCRGHGGAVPRAASDGRSRGRTRPGRTLPWERGGKAAPHASTSPHDNDLCAQTPERGACPGGSLRLLKAAATSQPGSWARYSSGKWKADIDPRGSWRKSSLLSDVGYPARGLARGRRSADGYV